MARSVVSLLAVLLTVGLLSGCQSDELSSRAEEWLDRAMPDPDRILEPWEIPTRFPDRVTLTWSDDPVTTFSVTWRTDTTVAAGIAQLALADASPRLEDLAEELSADLQTLDLSDIDGEFVRAHFHSVTFRDLDPGSEYAYRVGDGEVWSEWFHTRTAPSSAEPFAFIYFGDAQNDIRSLWSRTIRAAILEEPEVRFLIHAGDLVNRAHRNVEWGEWYEAGGWVFGMVPSIPVPGNHEYRGYDEANGERFLSALWRPQFTLPENGIAGLEETSYFIDYPGVRVIGLNSNRMVEEQVPWLEERLEENAEPWTVVTFHHPVFSSSGDRDNPELRAAWKPLFDAYRVDLVLQGHDHTYARGRVTNVPVGSNGRDDASGTVYVNSVSGPKMYDIKDDRWLAYGANMERGAENTQLYQIVRIDGDMLSYEAFTVTGETYDAFDLIKQAGRANRFVSRVPEDLPERTHENSRTEPVE